MRGADQEGQVANFVETEQIVEYQGNKSSFVQVSFYYNEGFIFISHVACVVTFRRL